MKNRMHSELVQNNSFPPGIFQNAFPPPGPNRGNFSQVFTLRPGGTPGGKQSPLLPFHTPQPRLGSQETVSTVLQSFYCREADTFSTFASLSSLGDGGWSCDPSFLMVLRKFIDFNFVQLSSS